MAPPVLLYTTVFTCELAFGWTSSHAPSTFNELWTLMSNQENGTKISDLHLSFNNVENQLIGASYFKAADQSSAHLGDIAKGGMCKLNANLHAPLLKRRKHFEATDRRQPKPDCSTSHQSSPPAQQTLPQDPQPLALTQQPQTQPVASSEPNAASSVIETAEGSQMPSTPSRVSVEAPVKVADQASERTAASARGHERKPSTYFDEGTVFELSCPNNSHIDGKTMVLLKDRKTRGDCLEIKLIPEAEQQADNFEHWHMPLSEEESSYPWTSKKKEVLIDMDKDLKLEGNTWVVLKETYNVSYQNKVANRGILSGPSIMHLKQRLDRLR